MKEGHEFVIRGIDPSTGKEYGDYVIRSRHDLIKIAKFKQAENSEFIQKDNQFVWTPWGRDAMNPEYRKRAQEVRAYQKMESDLVVQKQKEKEAKEQGRQERIAQGETTSFDFIKNLNLKILAAKVLVLSALIYLIVSQFQ